MLTDPPNISTTNAPSGFPRPARVPEGLMAVVTVSHILSGTCCFNCVFALVSLLGGQRGFG